MNPEFRYHVASLSAVFLALGIGILIGTAFVGARVVERQGKLITRLETQVTDLRREARERDRTEEALLRVAPALVRRQLDGVSVLVIQSGRNADAADRADVALRLAGAVPLHMVLPPDTWSALDTESPGALASAARTLGETLASGGDLNELAGRNLVRGDSPDGPVRFVVFAGGGAKNEGSPDEPAAPALARARDLPIAEALRAKNVTVVGVETYTAEVTSVGVYRSAGLATIDCIDRAAGQIALPFVLHGADGAFGLKPSADRVLPDSIADEARLQVTGERGQVTGDRLQGVTATASPAPTPSTGSVPTPKPQNPTPNAQHPPKP